MDVDDSVTSTLFERLCGMSNMLQNNLRLLF